MTLTPTKNIYYKMSINLGPFCCYQNSKVYEIREGKSTILPGLFYSLVTILLGWWGFRFRKPLESFKNSFEALYINFNGGEDISELVTDYDYSSKTNYVRRNLLRKTSEKLTVDEIDMILEIQEEYTESQKQPYTGENVDFILMQLVKIDIHRINREDILDIFDALKGYELTRS